jgi:arginyl-tRNA synthetase
MILTHKISSAFVTALQTLYGIEAPINDVLISNTKKEFTGDYTIVLFAFTKATKESPELMGNKIGTYLKENFEFIEDFNVIKGFLNLTLSINFWKDSLTSLSEGDYWAKPKRNEKVLVEFSSPNTNKPLHLGHIRNILLGWSVSKILEANGYEVIKTQIINDRGIAICKSMLSWQKFGLGATPQSTGIKSDHFVGDYYVMFENKFQEEYKAWQEGTIAHEILELKNISEEKSADFFKNFKNTYFNEYSTLGKEAREMLQQWEAGDQEVMHLWQKMNGWVYDGFNTTYLKLAVQFDKNYYESATYLLGKSTVEEGLKRGVFKQESDGSVWIDLTDVGMDRKIVLRSDGTSVYITQDIGTAMERHRDFGFQKLIYTVADEQDYHFKVLFEILKRLGEPYANGLHHLSYGMVDLTTGKMKSREGTVVDADDLIDEVISEAKLSSQERGEITELNSAEQAQIFERIGFAALKFFILKVAPKKRMTFNPHDSLDMQGQTGPYIQNAYVRICSLFRKNKDNSIGSYDDFAKITDSEKEVLQNLMAYPSIIEEAAKNFDPSSLANYCYDLAKSYHKMYHDVRILGAELDEERNFRLKLSTAVGKTIKHGMQLLGIEMVDRM